MLIIRRVPIHPAIAAPIIRTRLDLLPVSKKASVIPGKAAWDIASPSRLCLRRTAYAPSAPLTIPKTAEPSATVLSV